MQMLTSWCEPQLPLSVNKTCFFLLSHRWLLMGAGGWDSWCDAGISSSHHSSPSTQVRRWRRYRGHGGGNPSHCSSHSWGVFCTTFRPHPCLLQRYLCLSYLVGGSLPAHQQLVRHLLSPVSDAELSWIIAPLCRLYTLQQAKPAPEENTRNPPTHTKHVYASEGLIMTEECNVLVSRQRKCWMNEFVCYT